MVKHIHEPILAEEQEFVCLLCETRFFKAGAPEAVCPQCGAKEPDQVVLVSEFEEEDR